MTKNSSYFRLQFIVFALVSAAFTNIYVTQPVLPVLQNEFSADLVLVSFSVSAVILGIAITNLPFGFLADRLPIHPIIFTGGIMLAAGAIVCAIIKDLWILIGARFVQGLFIPALTTCLAAYLAKTLPAAPLNVVMGSYVSGPVLGGLCGRLLGGWIHPPLLYLVYIVGIFIGPISGQISNRFGSGNTLLAGSFVLGGALILIWLPSIIAVVAGLLATCAGFFTIHSAAVGALNRKLSSGHGRSNSLYVLFYYIGGWLGITGSGLAYKEFGWSALICISMVLLIIPFSVGLSERKSNSL